MACSPDIGSPSSARCAVSAAFLRESAWESRSCLLAELGLLPRLGVGLLDLAEPEPELVGLLGALPGPGRELGQLVCDLLVPFVGLLVGAQRLDQLVARVTVEGGALAAGLEQPLLVHLTVHGDEILGQVGERPDGDRTAAEPGARCGPRRRPCAR